MFLQEGAGLNLNWTKHHHHHKARKSKAECSLTLSRTFRSFNSKKLFNGGTKKKTLSAADQRKEVNRKSVCLSGPKKQSAPCGGEDTRRRVNEYSRKTNKARRQSLLCSRAPSKCRADCFRAKNTQSHGPIRQQKEHTHTHTGHLEVTNTAVLHEGQMKGCVCVCVCVLQPHTYSVFKPQTEEEPDVHHLL